MAIRKILAGAALLAAGSAGAADLPNLKEPVPPPAPEPVFTWTSFYVGVNGGFGLDHASVPYVLTYPAAFAGGTTGMTERGPLFGGQIGYLYQLSGIPSLTQGMPLLNNVVVGVEADSDWADINGRATAVTPLGTAVFGTRIKDFGTIRGRLGYSFDRLLLYVSAGFSYATTENYYSVPGFSGSASVLRVPPRFAAYSIGGEYAFAQNWTFRAEYLYDYIRANWNDYAPAPGTQVQFASRATFHVVRFGLNYQFDLFTPQPVVARY
ncbi:MAG TPA: outer membrane beta-barrel protein [Methylovirgula sp.]|nr:outer membrane beta-barrel protein [Methylovirgula sp.]